MKPLHYKKHTLAKRGLSLLCVLALCLGLLPVTALAVGEIDLYVAGQRITESGCYANQNGTWTKVDGTEPASGQFYYDAATFTLTLNEAEITHDQTVNVAEGYTYYGSVIAFSQSADVSLKIVVSQGTSTITGNGGIRVESTTGNASLSIKGPGSLDVKPIGSNSGITLYSSKNRNLDINGADVTASSRAQHGVYLISSTAATTSTITVNNGSLTTGGNGHVGIYYYWSGTNNAGTSSLTVSGNAVVDTRNSKIQTNNEETVVQVGAGSDGNGGIVFNGKSGTVYGNVTLQEDLAIGTDESLTIPDDSSLNSNGKLTNNGKIIVDNGGKLEGTINGNQPPKITTERLNDGTVNTKYNQTLVASGDATITWSSSDLPNWLTLNSDGTISGTPTAAGVSTFTVTATNDNGSDSKALTLTINPAPILVTGVTLNKSELALYTGGSATLSATVTPENATNTSLTWASDAENIATVDQSGNVKAVGAGTATITATAADGSGISATCTVTVTDKTYTISADTTALNFGSAYTGYAQPAAQTVIVENTGNQPVTLNQPVSTDNFEVGALSTTTLAAGETATFTVQPKAGLSAGTYSDTITINGTGGAAVTTSASFTVKSRPSYNPPTVSEETADAIADAQPGETVTVDLSSGSTKLDKEVFETLAGKDVTLVVELGDGLSWTVNGSDIPEDADFVDIDMGVTMNSVGIPVDLINAITGEHGSVQMTLAHNGEFGFTMTLTAPLGKENAGYWANLYHYKVNGGEADREDPLGDDERAEALNFEAAAKIDEDGSVKIPFSHASQYAIVIDTHGHATVDVSDLFIDVAPNAWYKDAVQYAYDHGLMTGTSANEFAPEATTTRAMIVSILARLEGVESAQAAGFADVDDEWYATAVNWAANVGVVNGYEDNTFQPNTAITREQLAAILMNYASYKGEDVSNRADLGNYTDQPSTWATETMSWAVAEGLINGVTNDQLQPQGNATRAQVAAILQRFLEA